MFYQTLHHLALSGLLFAHTAYAVDLHKLWENRCSDCHGHSSELARNHLTVEDGKLQGSRPERDLHGFLQQHYLQNSGEIDAVYDMLRAQASTQAQFKERCSACHNSAAQLMRDAPLLHQDGQSLLPGTQKPLPDFMQQHVKLSPEQVQFFVELLERLDREVNPP